MDYLLWDVYNDGMSTQKYQFLYEILKNVQIKKGIFLNSVRLMDDNNIILY